MVSVSLIAAPGTSAAKKTGAVAAKRYHAVQIVDRDVVLRGTPRGYAGRLMMLPFADNERQVLAPNPNNGDPGRQVLAPNPDSGDMGRQVLTPNPDNGDMGRQVLAPNPDSGDNGRQVLAPNPDGQ
jgi:hypothetical protein